MGLDTYAMRETEEFDENNDVVMTGLDDSLFDGIHLIGGMCSGGSGSHSFRGKCYDDDVEKITGQSLYQESIAPVTVKEMARKITIKVGQQEDCKHVGNDWDCESCRLTHLKRWFQVAAENDAYVVGWW